MDFAVGMHGLPRALFCFEIALPFTFILAVNAFAQAWVPPKGEGDLTLIYQNFYTRDHTDGNAAPFDDGQVRLFGMTQSVDYGITNKLAVTGSVPYAFGKYSGTDPHQLPIDDGNYHSSFQDLGIAARYNIRSRPLMLTPFMRFSFPMQKYEYFAHSAIGMRLWEIRLGLSFGRRLESILPNTFFQGSYSYSVTQNMIGYRPNRSRMELEVGHFLTRRLAVRALAFSMITHGGAAFDDIPDAGPLWLHHDQILRIKLLNVGGGLSYSVTRSLDVFASMVTSVWSENHHPAQPGLVAGVSWSFRTRRAAARLSFEEDVAANSPVAVAGRKVRCACK